MAIIKLENVSFTYPNSKNRALCGLSLEIAEGEFIAVMGENGSGKTSFCKLLNGVIPHSQDGKFEGAVYVDEIHTSAVGVPALASCVAVVLDDPDAQLFTSRVYDEVAFGLENLCLDSSEIKRRITQVFDVSGLGAYAQRNPATLSGGQKQRLAIAAALAMEPKILVLDEPVSQLDPGGATEVLSLIRQIRSTRSLTVVMATHNSDAAAEFADKVCILNKGSIVVFDTPRAIFGNEQLLCDNGIRPPDVSALAYRLAEKGRPLPCIPLHIAEAKTAVLQWRQGIQ